MNGRQNKRWAGVCAFIVFLLAGAAGAEEKPLKPGEPDFIKRAMTKLDDAYRGNKSRGEMTMTVQTKHWKRQMSIDSWSLGKDYSLMRILKPLKEKGTATLKAKNDLYIYLNKTERTIKITSGMMGSSWMGSHFTNDDLVHHTRLSVDFYVNYDGEQENAGEKVWKFTLKPHPDAPVVWGKIEITLRAKDAEPLSQLFFDEDNKPVRVLEFSEHKKVGDRVVPFKMLMKPLDGSGEYTEIKIESIDFGVSLGEDFFSLQKLKSL
ncbi:MAG: outer membrane lipoprotein-sorting protein [Pseudomonadota bacterium]